MRGIKIPQYEFALKMQGGLMREGGGRICETLRYTNEKEIIPICPVRTINADYFIWPKAFLPVMVFVWLRQSQIVRFVHCGGFGCPCALYSNTGSSALFFISSTHRVTLVASSLCLSIPRKPYDLSMLLMSFLVVRWILASYVISYVV